MSQGFVSLVGAGPGDPELITLKGLRRLRAAQVVVHDALIGQELLEECRPDAEIVDAGKRAGGPTRRQEWINHLLVEQARRGLQVVRLKGGDPFIFGRGAEEAEALVTAGVVWEVVPGVSAAIAAPAYAGIPLTHRTHAASFAVVTGHEPTDRAGSRLRWEALSPGMYRPQSLPPGRRIHPAHAARLPFGYDPLIAEALATRAAEQVYDKS